MTNSIEKFKKGIEDFMKKEVAETCKIVEESITKKLETQLGGILNALAQISRNPINPLPKLPVLTENLLPVQTVMREKLLSTLHARSGNSPKRGSILFPLTNESAPLEIQNNPFVALPQNRLTIKEENPSLYQNSLNEKEDMKK